jgi:small subunit ribosomal protein S21
MTQKRVTPIVLYLRHTQLSGVSASTGLSEELLKRRRRTEVSVSYNWQPWCPSAGTLSNIDVGSYRWCPWYPSCVSVRQWPERLGNRPINRPIEEEHRVQVLVRDNNVDQALKVLKRKMQREGVFREMKLRGHYEKPSERRVREKAEAIRRARKLARKKLQREGLLPMKPRAIPGALGRAGPPRAPRF